MHQGAHREIASSAPSGSHASRPAPATTGRAPAGQAPAAELSRPAAAGRAAPGGQLGGGTKLPQTGEERPPQIGRGRLQGLKTTGHFFWHAWCTWAGHGKRQGVGTIVEPPGQAAQDGLPAGDRRLDQLFRRVAVLAACTKTRVGSPGGGPRTSISTAGALAGHARMRRGSRVWPRRGGAASAVSCWAAWPNRSSRRRRLP